MLKDSGKIQHDLSTVQNFIQGPVFAEYDQLSQQRVVGIMQALCYVADHCEGAQLVEKMINEMFVSLETFGNGHDIPPAWERPAGWVPPHGMYPE